MQDFSFVLGLFEELSVVSISFNLGSKGECVLLFGPIEGVQEYDSSY